MFVKVNLKQRAWVGPKTREAQKTQGCMSWIFKVKRENAGFEVMDQYNN